MKLEFPGPSQPEAPKPPKKGLLERLRENRMLQAGIVAGALHGAAAEAGHIKDLTHDLLQKEWEKPNMVLEPQGEEEQRAIKERVAWREAHTDKAAVEAYKAKATQEMKQGKEKTLGERFFDLARLNGESAKDVELAKRKAESLIEGYANDVGDDLDFEKMKAISAEMYGPDAAYEWGQGSAIGYFDRGERNCTAIAEAQEIVMEGVLAHMSPEARKQWHPIMQREKQHWIAGLEYIGADGKRDDLYLLEGKMTRIWHGDKDEAGTAVIPLETIKRAMVSSTPIEITTAGGEVASSPDIDVVVDEPVRLNLNVIGPLKGAGFNLLQASRQNIEPRQMTAEEIRAQEDRIKDKVIEFDVLEEPTKADVQARIEKAKGQKFAFDGNRGVWHDHVDAVDLKAPDAETVMLLDDRSAIDSISYGDMSEWSPQAVQQALQNHVPTMVVYVNDEGHLPSDLLVAYTELNDRADANIGAREFIFDAKGPIGETGELVIPDDIVTILSAKHMKVVNASTVTKSIYGMKLPILIDAPRPDQTLIIDGSDMPPEGIAEMAQTKGRILVSPDAYLAAIHKKPELLKNEHLGPDLTETSSYDQLLRGIMEIDPNAPIVQTIRDRMIKGRLFVNQVQIDRFLHLQRDVLKLHSPFPSQTGSEAKNVP